MDISIASGTYNRLPYLQAMIESVRQSTNPPGVYGLEYEIVLADGGSTDGTIEWCKSQPDIKLIEHGELLGGVKAFNDAAYAATGRWVIMANDDIEFVGDSIYRAYLFMEQNLNVGGGCFWQDRNERDWHVEGMQAVQIKNKRPERVHVFYAQVGIFPKWLGDQVGWWCDEADYAQNHPKGNYSHIKGARMGLHTYGGDNELSARIIDLGFDVVPIHPDKPIAKITDKEADDGLRKVNNIDGAKDPRSLQGHHPDSFNFGQKWINRNTKLGYHGHYPGPILKDKIMIPNLSESGAKDRILYLPLFEPGWQVLKEQKRGLRDALSKKGVVIEYDYMARHNAIGKQNMMTELYDICRNFRPTMIVTQLHNADMINGGDITNIRNHCTDVTIVNWNGDYWPDQILRDDGIALARKFDLNTLVNRDAVEEQQKLGINTRYWQIGWEPDGRDHEPTEYHDVVFLASGYSQKRQELGQWLNSRSFSFGLYGQGWPEGMAKGQNLYDFKSACQVYRGAKIAIGDSQWPESGFVSNRIFQILAAGGCILCHQWFRDYERLGLVDGKNCVIWKDIDDLQGKLRYWLLDQNSDLRKAMALEGERLALTQHSFDARVTELWHMLGIGVEQSDNWRW